MKFRNNINKYIGGGSKTIYLINWFIKSKIILYYAIGFLLLKERSDGFDDKGHSFKFIISI